MEMNHEAGCQCHPCRRKRKDPRMDPKNDVTRVEVLKDLISYIRDLRGYSLKELNNSELVEDALLDYADSLDKEDDQ